MTPCRLCGELVDIRYVGGRLIPIHPSGRCGGAQGPSQLGRLETRESSCFLTRCPVPTCQQPVFFIRHNGGSVWVDPPLGYPWNRHGCMHPEVVKAGRSLALVSPGRIPRGLDNAQLVLAVVTVVERWRDGPTRLHLAAGEADRWSVAVKGNCLSLLGQLVIFDRDGLALTPIDRPDYVFRVLEFTRLDAAESEL